MGDLQGLRNYGYFPVGSSSLRLKRYSEFFDKNSLNFKVLVDNSFLARTCDVLEISMSALLRDEFQESVKLLKNRYGQLKVLSSWAERDLVSTSKSVFGEIEIGNILKSKLDELSKEFRNSSTHMYYFSICSKLHNQIYSFLSKNYIVPEGEVVRDFFNGSGINYYNGEKEVSEKDLTLYATGLMLANRDKHAKNLTFILTGDSDFIEQSPPVTLCVGSRDYKYASAPNIIFPKKIIWGIRRNAMHDKFEIYRFRKNPNLEKRVNS